MRGAATLWSQMEVQFQKMIQCCRRVAETLNSS